MKDSASSDTEASPKHASTKIQFFAFDSFVNPNARCPKCGAPVFYYQSPYGGRVFFDELGPPWPKHPCTSATPPAPYSAVAMITPPVPPVETPQWQANGLTPLVVLKANQEDDWWVIRADLIAERDNTPVRLLSEQELPLQRGSLAFFGGWDERGYGIIRFLGRDAEALEAPVYKYGEFFLASPRDAAAARRDQN